MSGWRRTGIDGVISLLESDEAAQLDLLDESRAAEANGIHFVSFQMPDRGVPASKSAFLALIESVANELAQGKTSPCIAVRAWDAPACIPNGPSKLCAMLAGVPSQRRCSACPTDRRLCLAES